LAQPGLVPVPGAPVLSAITQATVSMGSAVQGDRPGAGAVMQSPVPLNTTPTAGFGPSVKTGLPNSLKSW